MPMIPLSMHFLSTNGTTGKDVERERTETSYERYPQDVTKERRIGACLRRHTHVPQGPAGRTCRRRPLGRSLWHVLRRSTGRSFWRSHRDVLRIYPGCQKEGLREVSSGRPEVLLGGPQNVLSDVLSWLGPWPTARQGKRLAMRREWPQTSVHGREWP